MLRKGQFCHRIPACLQSCRVANFLPCANSFFKTLVDHQVTVELKNDVSIKGTLKSVDQYLNIKLEDITVVDEIKYPHLVRDTCSAKSNDSKMIKADHVLLRARSRTSSFEAVS